MLGLYPTWFEPGVGSGWIIGFIATIHVLFSHASVGGAVLFAWLANFAVRRDKPAYLAFIRRYGLFLLIFSYVLGSITGPGIWFAATIASPRGISALIHSFVWLWASEWVFFVIEVIGVYLLVYLAGRVDPRTHTRISIIFGLASVATLLVSEAEHEDDDRHHAGEPGTEHLRLPRGDEEVEDGDADGGGHHHAEAFGKPHRHRLVGDVGERGHVPAEGNQLVGRDVPALGIRSELPLMAEKGVLATHPFMPEHLRKVTPENEVEAGRALALTLCSNCHSLTSTGMRPLERFFPADADRAFLADYLGAGLYRGHSVYMPPVPLPEAERGALAAYIESILPKKGAAK